MIGFAGLSHLGLVSGIAAASRGFDVAGYDPDAALCDGLDCGHLPVFEPGLPELLAEGRPRLRFTADPSGLSGCDVIVFARDVPTDDDGRSDLAPLRRLIDDVLPHAKAGAVPVVLSQVPPGFTRGLDGGRHGLTWYYQVETLIFGRAVERALHPEHYIVGCRDPRAPLPAPFAGLLAASDCPVLPMRYESAELTKIAINMCLVSSVSTANTLAEVCESIGADWSEIVPALKLDRRIGPHSYLAAGLGLSGGNLERDLATVRSMAHEHGTDAGVVDAWLGNSAYRRDWALRTLHAEVLSRVPDPTVAVWGLAYKPDTHSTKNSPAVALIGAIPGVPFRAYDPQVVLDPSAFPNVVRAVNPLDACRGADALIITTPWAVFSTVNPRRVREALGGRVVIDPFNAFNPAGTGLTHHRLGAAATRGAERLIQHHRPQPAPPSRVVVLGATGFVAGDLIGHLGGLGVEIVPVPSSRVDLREPSSASALREILRPDDALVFVSALTPDRGRDIRTLMMNLAMAENVCAALEQAPCAHAVYVGSDAVYADDANPVRETSCCDPSGFHGLMHLTRERMLLPTLKKAGTPLLLLRPSLLFGARDTHNGYGPNRFLRTALSDRKITLFGGGEEKRDHVSVGDLSRLIGLALYRRTEGVLNVATGEAISFHEAARLIAEEVGGDILIEPTPPQNPITHRHFDVTATLKAFPGFRYTPTREALAGMVAEARRTAEAGGR